MSHYTKLSFVPAQKLSETYNSIYKLQHKLELPDEYLLNTTRCSPANESNRANLVELLESSKVARDNLITWYLKQPIVELNVTISLLTAKIKFIEYKLGICDGLDLHQACSISLVDFCNILADMTIVNVGPSERKTMKQVSAEAGVPVWLSHYRNQICHVPSESPCISVLVPLVAKSLDYMQEAFWSRVLEQESFDEQKLKKYLNYVSKLTYVTTINKRLQLKRDAGLSKRRLGAAERNLSKYSKACHALRRMMAHNPRQSLDLVTRFLCRTSFKDRSINRSLLLEQILLSKQFENFVFKLATLAIGSPLDLKIKSWLLEMVALISRREQRVLNTALKVLELNNSEHMKALADVSPLKCCQLAFLVSKIEAKYPRKLLKILQPKLVPILGEERAELVWQLRVAVSKYYPK